MELFSQFPFRIIHCVSKCNRFLCVDFVSLSLLWLISLNQFQQGFCLSLGFSTYEIMSFVNTDNFTSSNQIAFISFLYLMSLDRMSKTTLDRSGKSKHSCFASNCRGKVFSFINGHHVYCGFSCVIVVVSFQFQSVECFYDKSV